MIRVHIDIHMPDVYIMIQLHYSSVSPCSGYTSRDSVYCCTYARMHVHVPGTHYIIHVLQQQTSAEVLIVVLQLLAVSAAAAAACLAL